MLSPLSVLLAGNDAITVFLFEKHWRAEALKSAVGEDGDAIAEQVGLVHEVSRQDYRASLSLFLQYVPRLTTSFRVHAGRGLVQDHELCTPSSLRSPIISYTLRVVKQQTLIRHRPNDGDAMRLRR